MQILVEYEIARRFTVLYSKSGQRFIFRVEPQHLTQVDRADDIDIMQDEGVIMSVLEKEPARFLQSATGIEQAAMTRADLPEWS